MLRNVIVSTAAATPTRRRTLSCPSFVSLRLPPLERRVSRTGEGAGEQVVHRRRPFNRQFQAVDFGGDSLRNLYRMGRSYESLDTDLDMESSKLEISSAPSRDHTFRPPLPI